MKLHSTTPCPGCGNYDLSVFLELPPVPVFCNVLWDSAAAACAAPRAPIHLAYCAVCGMIYNVAFDPHLMRYTGAYDNTLQFSPRFRSHAQRLCQYLVGRYDLHGKHIIEVGCGDAGVLAMLCQLGPNEGVGFDPAYDSSHVAPAEGMRIVPEPYGQEHAHLPVDLILCRQVFEHIPSPLHFLVSLRRTIGDRKDVVVFFGVPNGLKMLRDAGIWDVIYEHCSYFTPASIERLFVLAGFDPIRVSERYEGQFLDMEARPATRGAPYPPADLGEALPEIQQRAEAFGAVYTDCVNHWRSALSAMAGQRTVIWGAGSKGVMFLNAAGVGEESIRYAVDINPRKHNRYIPGTGQRIISPQELRDYRPHVVLVMNAVYRQEIEAMLAELGIRAEVRPISAALHAAPACGPSVDGAGPLARQAKATEAPPQAAALAQSASLDGGPAEPAQVAQ